MFNHIKLTKAQLLALRDFGTEQQDRLLVARFLANIFNTNVLRKHGYENGKTYLLSITNFSKMPMV